MNSDKVETCSYRLEGQRRLTRGIRLNGKNLHQTSVGIRQSDRRGIKASPTRQRQALERGGGVREEPSAQRLAVLVQTYLIQAVRDCIAQTTVVRDDQRHVVE